MANLKKYQSDKFPSNQSRREVNNTQTDLGVRIERGKKYYIVSDDIIFLRSPFEDDVMFRTGSVSDDIIFLRVPPGDALVFNREDVQIGTNSTYIKVIKTPGQQEGPTRDTNSQDAGTANPPATLVPEGDSIDDTTDTTTDTTNSPAGQDVHEFNLNESVVVVDMRQILIFGTEDEGGKSYKSLWSFLVEEISSIKVSRNDQKLQVYLRRAEADE